MEKIKGYICVFGDKNNPGQSRIEFCNAWTSYLDSLNANFLDDPIYCFCTYLVPDNIDGLSIFKLIDILSPSLRLAPDKNFYSISPEDMYELLESIVVFTNTQKMRRLILIEGASEEEFDANQKEEDEADIESDDDEFDCSCLDDSDVNDDDGYGDSQYQFLLSDKLNTTQCVPTKLEFGGMVYAVDSFQELIDQSITLFLGVNRDKILSIVEDDSSDNLFVQYLTRNVDILINPIKVYREDFYFEGDLDTKDAINFVRWLAEEVGVDTSDFSYYVKIKF